MVPVAENGVKTGHSGCVMWGQGHGRYTYLGISVSVGLKYTHARSEIQGIDTPFVAQ